MIPLISFSQLSVKKVEPSQKIGEYSEGKSYVVFKMIPPSDEVKDTSYLIIYQNEDYESITSLESVNFKGKQTLTDLYDILKSFFKEENIKNEDYAQHFDLGKSFVSAYNSTVGKKTKIRIYVKGKGQFTMNEKQLDLLFGKK